MSKVTIRITKEALYDITTSNQSNIWKSLQIEFVNSNWSEDQHAVTFEANVFKELPENTRIKIWIVKNIENGRAYYSYKAIPVVDGVVRDDLSWTQSEDAKFNWAIYQEEFKDAHNLHCPEYWEWVKYSYAKLA